MIRPTRRAVLLFALGVPFAFLLVVLDPALWEFCLDFGALVLIALGVDALLTLPRRRLEVEVDLPEALYVGEAGEIKVVLAARRYARANHDRDPGRAARRCRPARDPRRRPLPRPAGRGGAATPAPAPG